ncbi:GtrA family protein [Gardnerella swidsinskii]|uniref:GtrA family protein n=2 Tax=Bifidobacteriaceae TaxID=31953 RepID=A0A9X7FGD9_9BIFI|nr:GtrA family protein [Gardnerella swidsinskii]RIY27339.1 sugar translocase [Bifidobacteriaceae bacterium WP021]
MICYLLAAACLMDIMKKLIEQVVKFGIVGIIALIIDVALLNLLMLAHLNNVVAGTISFVISLIFNYIASMKYVFKHREDMAKWMELLIFVISAVIGLLINDLIIWASTLGMVESLRGSAVYVLRTNIGKLVATVVVAVWNFVIRKWLLDDTKSQQPGYVAQEDTSFAHRLGMWSLNHTKNRK